MHTHSSFSPDADRNAAVSLMAEQAEKLGLGYITVTDHCDCVFWNTGEEFDYPDYQQTDSMMFGAGKYSIKSIKEINRLKDRYPNLLCGTELGEPLQNMDAAEITASMEGLDLVIGSLHMNTGKPDFYWLDYKSMTSDEITLLLDDYFDELLEMCRVCDFDILAHLTYPLRYIEGEHGIIVSTERYTEKIAAIFRQLIYRGKGLEINTSGLRQKYGRTFPDRELIKLYYSLGGEIITLGSDAHRLIDIGAGLREGAELAQSAGFRYTAVFKNRKPSFEKI